MNILGIFERQALLFLFSVERYGENAFILAPTEVVERFILCCVNGAVLTILNPHRQWLVMDSFEGWMLKCPCNVMPLAFSSQVVVVL